MSAVTLDLSGVAEVNAALARVTGKTEGAVQAVIERYVGLIAREAKGLAPVDSGALRENIRGELERLAGSVLSDLPYSAAVELGRTDLPAYPVQPYLGPAFETHRAAFIRDVERAVGRSVGAVA